MGGPGTAPVPIDVWQGPFDGGEGKYRPTFGIITGRTVIFGRDFAPATPPETVGGFQRQYITGATFPVPIMNAALAECLDRNLGQPNVYGTANLWDPNTPNGVPTTLQTDGLLGFGPTDYTSPLYTNSLSGIKEWIKGSQEHPLVSNWVSSFGLTLPIDHIPMTEEEKIQWLDKFADPAERTAKNVVFGVSLFLGFVPCGDAAVIAFHGGLWIMGDDSWENKLDLAFGCIGLVADLGYAAVAAGVATNLGVAAAKLAFKYIWAIDNGRTLKLMLSHGDDLIESIRHWVVYLARHRPEWLSSVNWSSPWETAAAVQRFAVETGGRLIDTFRRVANSPTAQKLGQMYDATGAPLLIRNYEETVKALDDMLIRRVARRVLKSESVEGWRCVAALRQVPELNTLITKLRGSLDAAGTDAALDAADLALDRSGEAWLKTLQDGVTNEQGLVRDAHGIARVQDATKVIVHGVDPGRFAAAVSVYVGPGKAFATAEEFFAATRMAGRNLDPVNARPSTTFAI